MKRISGFNFFIGACVLLSVTVCRVSGVNIPVSSDPPGGLDPTNTPQILLLTFDDTVNSDSYERVQRILTNHFNPNGSPIQATFFCNTDYTDFRLVEQLYSQGHEIGVHTITHTTYSNTPLDSWRMEIVGCRKALSELALVPINEIVGLRVPYLAFNNDSFQVLQEAEMRYDASIEERIDAGGELTTNISSFIWPYTFDAGNTQECITGIPPWDTFPGLFEIPLWDAYDTGGWGRATMDAPTSSYAEVMSLWKHNFTEHYNGNRAPFGLFLHAALAYQWLRQEEWRVDVVNDFIEWTLGHSNVWWVSVNDLVEFMLDPQTVQEVSTFPPFITSTNHHILSPEEEVNVQYYHPYGSIRTSASLPPLWPVTDTVYHVWQEMPSGSGVVSNWLHSAWTDTFVGYLEVSNSTPFTILDWEASFVVENGVVTNFWGMPFAVSNGICTVRPNGYHMPMPPGAAYTNRDTGADSFGFWGGWNNTNSVVIHPADLTLYKSGQGPPSVTNIGFVSNAHLRIEWDESAYGYDLQFSTNIATTDTWESVSNIFIKTTWTGSLPAAESPTFFRLETIY